jgi:hypothetical protein
MSSSAITTENYAYYAVGQQDGFLRGATSLKGPWDILDDSMQLRDVATVHLSISSMRGRSGDLHDVDSDLEILGIGLDNRIYVKDVLSAPWRLLLPNDPLRVISIVALRGGSIVAVGADYRRYIREDLHPDTAWRTSLVSNEAIKAIDEIIPADDVTTASPTSSIVPAGPSPNTPMFVAVGVNGLLYTTEGYDREWRFVPPRVSLRDVATDREDRSTVYGLDASSKNIIRRPDLDPASTWQTHVEEVAEQRIGRLAVANHHADADDSMATTTDAWYVYFAVGTDGFLKGTNDLASRWISLDETMSLIDVTVLPRYQNAYIAYTPSSDRTLMPSAETGDRPYLLAIGQDNHLYIRDDLSQPWRRALLPAESKPLLSVVGRRDGSILVLGKNMRRYSRANLQPGTVWVPIPAPAPAPAPAPGKGVRARRVERPAARNTIPDKVYHDGELTSIDEYDFHSDESTETTTPFRLAVHRNGQVYQNPNKADFPWELLELLPQDTPEALGFIDVAFDRTVPGSPLLGIHAADNRVWIRKNMFPGTPWLDQGEASCCVTRIAAGIDYQLQDSF